jgi:hypothetical protein
MNTHIFTTRRIASTLPEWNVRVPRVPVCAFRAWLNEPPRHAPTPIAAHMYGLLLRPSDRPDIDRRA